MQRTLLIALAAAVVVAGIATTAAIVVTGDDEETAALPTPAAAAVPTAEATSSVETAGPGSTTSPDDGDGAGSRGAAAATATPTSATTKPGVTVRSAKDVDCDDESAFCSSVDSVEVADDTVETPLEESADPKSSTRPTITMESEVWDPDKDTASTGDEVGSIHVEVVVSNSSKDTFVFAKREIVLELYRNGRLYDSFATKGDGFEMTPGSSMSGKFDRPITDDGAYTWRAKVWYYEK